MICSVCQTLNRDEANFCKRCAHLLVDFCPACHIEFPADADFCDNCAFPLTKEGRKGHLVRPLSERQIATAPTSLQKYIPKELMQKLEAARIGGVMVGERRVVTMLFCDVKGSTAAAEKLDPEEWTDIINGAFEYMIKPVYQYEGTVARLMGDAILAFFGAPISHEDDPQRAVLAGLDIVAGIAPYREQVRQQWDLDFDVRVGINTGLVVVGAVGSDLRMEYTAMGDAINLAARMEQTAVPGTVQIAHDTYKAVRPFFEFEELGEIAVKGKEAPVFAYRVLRRKTMTGQHRGIEGLQTALVGRDLELASLQEILSVLQQGVGRIVSVIGGAGLGKSRLIREAKQSLEDAHSVDWFEAVSLSYETRQPYGLFQRLIRRFNGISPADTAEILREKVTTTLVALDDSDRERTLRLFEALFDLESSAGEPRLEGEDFRRELFQIMPIIWRKRFTRKPAVLVFDDMHWSDPASIELLLHLFPLTSEIPLVILAAFRPDRQGPVWQIKTSADEEYHHRYSDITLRPLSKPQVNEMVDSLLINADLPDVLRTQILERTGGIPLFVQEVVRSLIDSGAVLADERIEGGQPIIFWRAIEDGRAIEIPDNLHSLLAARIDRLEEETRQTLQMAAVIGRSFYRTVLEIISSDGNGSGVEIERQLSLLLRLEMIREAARVPEPEYKFSNPLTQEVAYQTILLKYRRDFHNRVGLAMEAVFPQQLAELSPQLAFHFNEGLNEARAFHYFTLAGDTAARLYANAEAIVHYDSALEIARRSHMVGEQLIHLHLSRGRALEHKGAFTQALQGYEELALQADNGQDEQIKLSALVAMGTILSVNNNVFDAERAESVGEKGLALARRLGDRAAEAKINWNLMQLALTRGLAGDKRRAITYGEASLALSRELDLREQMALTFNNLAVAYRSENQTAEAEAAGLEAQRLFRETGNLPMLADSYSQTSSIQLWSGQFEDALENARHTGEIAASIGNLWNQGAAGIFAGFIRLEQGDLGAAVAELKKVSEIEGMAQLQFMQAFIDGYLAMTYIELRALPLARLLVQALSASTANQPPFMSRRAQSLEASLYLAQVDVQAARKVLKSRPLQLNTDSILLAPFVLGDLEVDAEVALALGEYKKAGEIAAGALDLTEKLQSSTFLPIACYLRAMADQGMGEPEAARQRLALAHKVASAIGNRRTLWRILAAQAELNEDRHAAAGQRREAGEIVTFIADHAGTPQWRQSFLNRPDVRRAALMDQVK